MPGRDHRGSLCPRVIASLKYGTSADRAVKSIRQLPRILPQRRSSRILSVERFLWPSINYVAGATSAYTSIVTVTCYRLYVERLIATVTRASPR